MAVLPRELKESLSGLVDLTEILKFWLITCLPVLFNPLTQLPIFPLTLHFLILEYFKLCGIRNCTDPLISESQYASSTEIALADITKNIRETGEIARHLPQVRNRTAPKMLDVDGKW